MDGSPHSDISYYRLKQTDFGGQITELPIRKVEVNGAAMIIQIIRAYPNPFRESVVVEFASDFAASGTMVITNTNGSRVHIQPVNVREGISNLTLNIGDLAAGTYILQLIAGEVRTEEHRLIKSQ